MLLLAIGIFIAVVGVLICLIRIWDEVCIIRKRIVPEDE